MGLGLIRDLITHAGAELKSAPIAELGVERPGETKKNVSFHAPVVCEIARRVLNHADANRAEIASPPMRRAGFAGMLSRRDGRPIGGAKREIANLHVPRLVGSKWLRALANQSPHHDVTLKISPQLERLFPHVCEAALPVERDGARIALPDTQPDLISATSLSEPDSRGDEILRNPAAVPLFGNIETLKLRRLLRAETLGAGT